VEQAEHGVAERRHDTRGRATAHGTGIFAQHDIAHTVEGVLDSPVARTRCTKSVADQRVSRLVMKSRTSHVQPLCSLTSRSTRSTCWTWDQLASAR
jgi:hypothetical protein